MCRWNLWRKFRRIWHGGRRIITTVNELSNALDENVKVQILLSDYFEETEELEQINIEEMSNCIDMELTEFIKYLYEEIKKTKFKKLEKWGKVKWMY